MNGMPLTIDEIATFSGFPNLREMLDDLAQKNDLVLEHPQKMVVENGIRKRVFAEDVPMGYNILTGKLSFPFSKILDPNKGFATTLLATGSGKNGRFHAQPRPARSPYGKVCACRDFPEDYQIDTDYRKAFG